MIKVIVTGAAGRMGREIAESVIATEGLELAGGTEHKDHPAIGTGILEMLGHKESGPAISGDLKDVIDIADVIIDFTSPSPSVDHFNLATDRGKAIVIGSTGFSKEQIAAIHSRSSEAHCVLAPNMSVGVNVMFKLAEEAAKVLGSDYDMEIVEIHHNKKKDAPSGTAARLAEICAEATKRDIEKVAMYGRHGIVGERKPEEISVMSLRAGDVVGEHTLIFGGPGERLEITHRAGSRKNFAMGATRAAEWVVKQKTGIYDMQDVLSLREKG